MHHSLPLRCGLCEYVFRLKQLNHAEIHASLHNITASLTNLNTISFQTLTTTTKKTAMYCNVLGCYLLVLHHVPLCIQRGNNRVSKCLRNNNGTRENYLPIFVSVNFESKATFPRSPVFPSSCEKQYFTRYVHYSWARTFCSKWTPTFTKSKSISNTFAS